MKTSIMNVMAMSFAALISASIAQSKFSGIYSGSISTGVKFLAAITKGGRVLAMDSGTKGIREAIDPARSTISSAGKLKGTSTSGTIVAGTVYPDFSFKGTVKTGGNTARISGRRTFN